MNGATNAIELCEHLNNWDTYCRYAEVCGILLAKERMRIGAMYAMQSMSGEKREIVEKALAEWDHPDFLVYLRSKLGDI